MEEMFSQDKETKIQESIIFLKNKEMKVNDIEISNKLMEKLVWKVL